MLTTSQSTQGLDNTGTETRTTHGKSRSIKNQSSNGSNAAINKAFFGAPKFHLFAGVFVSLCLLAGCAFMIAQYEVKQDMGTKGEHRKQELNASEPGRPLPENVTKKISIKQQPFPKPQISIKQPFPKPLFVMSLPNHADLVLPRYFRCADMPTARIGRYWSRPSGGKSTGSSSKSPGKSKSPGRRSIGECFKRNMDLKGNRSITHGCGDFYAWLDLQHLAGPYTMFHKNKTGSCFDPVLYPGALERLYQAHPNATILNFIQDPQDWYRTLSKDFPWHWAEWCNPSHGNSFPEHDNQDNYVQFYNNYQNRLRSFLQQHHSLTYIEFDLRNSQESIAAGLMQQLGIPEKCWTNSFAAKVPEIPDEGDDDAFEGDTSNGTGDYKVKTTTGLLLNELRFPILVTALPKSGTTTIFEYFRCGLGHWTGAHQHTLNLTSFKSTTIGYCMMENLNSGLPLLHHCGNARVFSDIGIFLVVKNYCYYPTLHGGLEEFAKAYPYGTILHLRRNVKSWYDSSNRWSNLLDRWSGSNKLCHDIFPPSKSNQSAWEKFYGHHDQIVENFARKHPNISYLDIPLANAKTVLHETFGFAPRCWGHSNINKATPASS
ncbi:expressed unknown protein [Seminavis robusta]|uniref:Sulfotransferase domain-containing protein n=1 Tax=Seminavis robusta TaxID=568900 RepID=A0A9N8EGA7_9STRA|nr:expressed unknown protein [Seminavis robusta]|eukprot:Sro948_g223570.1 n/a (602) ;mRNA; f:23643-25448